MPTKFTGGKFVPDQKAKQRDAVRAAAAVFAEKGFHGASTGDIAERLGLKQGSLYYYFRSKEDALEQVCLYGIEKYVLRMEEIAASNEPFEAKLFATITSHLSSYRERDVALKVHNDERLYLPEHRRVVLKKLGSRYRQLLENMFVDGIRNGALRATVDAHTAAQLVIGLCNAFGELIVRNPDFDLFNTIHQVNDLLLNGLRERRPEQRDET